MALSLEERVSVLEKQIAKLESCSSAQTPQVPWWEKIRGTFKEDPIYDEAMKLGQEWRSSQPVPESESR